VTDYATELTDTQPATRLARPTAPAAALINHRRLAETGIVHLGLGNFHRAHQAVYTAAAVVAEDGPWGILGVANSSRTVVDAMTTQDMLYSVVEVSPVDSRVTVPGAHTGVVVANDNPAAVVDAIGAATTRLVTLTVTEHGYTFSAKSGALDTESAAIRHDLADASSPMTTIGRIARGLIMRARTHGAPVSVVSCDNLLGNGRRTEALVREFISQTADADEALSWMDDHVTFPNSMVDRIVPSSAPIYNDAARQSLGVVDEIAVPAEPFTMWVMENRFAAGRPAWEAGGATFTDDVEPYELLKVRLLNGTHSLIAYLGALDGRATIPESVAQPYIEAAARRVMIDDYLPTVRVPAQVNAAHYMAQLFERWSNTALGHRTAQVGSDGSAKLAQRIPIPAKLHLAVGRTPQHLALTLAAYLCCIAPPAGFDPGPHAAAMTDPARPRLNRLTAQPMSTVERVRSVLADGGLFPRELAYSDEFICTTAEFVDIIVAHGPRIAAAEANNR
jgi:fructuronate reductase